MVNCGGTKKKSKADNAQNRGQNGRATSKKDRCHNHREQVNDDQVRRVIYWSNQCADPGGGNGYQRDPPQVSAPAMVWLPDLQNLA